MLSRTVIVCTHIHSVSIILFTEEWGLRRKHWIMCSLLATIVTSQMFLCICTDIVSTPSCPPANVKCLFDRRAPVSLWLRRFCFMTSLAKTKHNSQFCKQNEFYIATVFPLWRSKNRRIKALLNESFCGLSRTIHKCWWCKCFRIYHTPFCFAFRN